MTSVNYNIMRHTFIPLWCVAHFYSTVESPLSRPFIIWAPLLSGQPKLVLWPEVY